MSVDKKVHQAQTDILHVLLFTPEASFTELQKQCGLSSDYVTFHVKQLAEQKLVHKTAAGKYALTQKGKEFANRFDTDARVVERQPKVAVCLIVHDGENRTLMQQRLKQPYYGYWGRPTGKIRWGETIMETAARELMEETGLIASLTFRGVYHKMDYSQQSGDMLEDKIFFMLHGHNPQGDMQQTFEGGCNQWMTNDQIRALEHSFVDVDDTANMNHAGAFEITEAKHEYDPEHY